MLSVVLLKKAPEIAFTPRNNEDLLKFDSMKEGFSIRDEARNSLHWRYFTLTSGDELLQYPDRRGLTG